MKTILHSLVGNIILLLSFFSLPVLSATYDGQPPSEESVCDPLKADGVTKGLYGLCVAFCEAQDIASISAPLTEDELGAIMANAPSGIILESYNKKKTDSDPGMPCIMAQAPCPCWSNEELVEINGQQPSGIPYGVFNCQHALSGTVDTISIYEHETSGANLQLAAAGRYNQQYDTVYRCGYINQQSTTQVSRRLATDEGTLTQTQYDTCRQELLSQCQYYVLLP
jgi:hypothetical protein